jgi:hypothetical protein
MVSLQGVSEQLPPELVLLAELDDVVVDELDVTVLLPPLPPSPPDRDDPDAHATPTTVAKTTGTRKPTRIAAPRSETGRDRERVRRRP